MSAYKSDVRQSNSAEFTDDSLSGGKPCILRQSWQDVVFMHWQVPPILLQPLIPRGLSLDTFGAHAWLSLAGFKVRDVRIPAVPFIPAMPSFNELNLRTYVRKNGQPGTVFLDIHADSLLAVAINRMAGLPYHISPYCGSSASQFNYKNRKNEVAIHWNGMSGTCKSELDKWLTERYCNFQQSKGTVIAYPISHPEWDIQRINISGSITYIWDDYLFLSEKNIALAHYSPGIDVLFQMPHKVALRPFASR